MAGRYERLRQAVLSPGSDVLAGFGVVIGRGVSAWVHASLAAPEEARSGLASPRACLPREVPQADVVRVWAQMALAVHTKEVAAWTAGAGPRR